MAVIKAIKGKKGLTYYLVYSYQEYTKEGKKKNKIKWEKAGKTKMEADQALRNFNKKYVPNRQSFNQYEPTLFSDYIENQFLPWCKARKSPEGYIATKNCINRVSNYLGKIYLQDINATHIENYITWRKLPKQDNKTVSNRTVNLDLIYLSQSLKIARQYKLIAENPSEFVKKLKDNQGRLRFFSKEEIETLFQEANPYVKRILMIGLNTGMRHKELINIKIPQIDLANNVIHVQNTYDFQTKNRKNRDVPITPALNSVLKEYIDFWINPSGMSILPRTAKQKMYLFCNADGERLESLRKSYKNLLRKLKIKDACLHTMRHTYASYLVMSGVGLRTVQELLGHNNISVTERYAHLTDGHKQEAVKLLKY
jgi:site-specific recombinase XerD